MTVDLAAAALFAGILHAHLVAHGHRPDRVAVKGLPLESLGGAVVWQVTARCRRCRRPFDVLLAGSGGPDLAISFDQPELQTECLGGS